MCELNHISSSLLLVNHSTNHRSVDIDSQFPFSSRLTRPTWLYCLLYSHPTFATYKPLLLGRSTTKQDTTDRNGVNMDPSHSIPSISDTTGVHDSDPPACSPTATPLPLWAKNLHDSTPTPEADEDDDEENEDDWETISESGLPSRNENE